MDDEILMKMRPARATYWANYAIAALFILATVRLGPLGLAVGLLLIGVTELVRITETFSVTQTGVCREYKFLSKNRSFIDFRNIQDLDMKQGIMERMFGIGSVIVDTAGSDKHEELVMFGIKHPEKVQQLIQEHMDTRGGGQPGGPAQQT